MDDEPLVRVVRGVPTAAELAALVGVVASRFVVTDSRFPRTAPAKRSPWTGSARRGAAQVPGPAGPGAWRASGLPR
ncbi:MAG TPA: acyl-CoA carboxylase subunit epsilon [Actinoplanes sp.]